jgi:hypothetical protein
MRSQVSLSKRDDWTAGLQSPYGSASWPAAVEVLILPIVSDGFFCSASAFLTSSSLGVASSVSLKLYLLAQTRFK